MYTYVCEFNVGVRGDDEAEYILDSVRTWPELWGSIKGVTGTLLLSNAFALGGDYEYQWRVDIESLGTLARIDETVKAGERGWRKSRVDWFRHRTAVHSYISGHVAGDQQYCDQRKGKQRKGTDGAVHAVIRSAGGSKGFGERLDTVLSVPGVVTAQTLRPMLGSAGSGDETWLRLDGLERLDGLVEKVTDVGNLRLYGEIREIDGALFVGA
jgi:hypothetical protein